MEALNAIETKGLLRGGAALCADIGVIGVDSLTKVPQISTPTRDQNLPSTARPEWGDSSFLEYLL
jgi:hypothetical protein